MALPGGLEPPACGLGNRRSVLLSYGSSLPGRRRGSPVRTAARLHPRITRTEFAQTGSYATRMWWALSGASFGRPWLCAPIRFHFAV